MRRFTLLCLPLTLILAGCGGMLPSGKDRVISPWQSFDEVKSAYDQVQLHITREEALKALGFSPDQIPNVRILNQLEIINRVLPHQSLKKEDLPEGLRSCLDLQNGCRAYELKLLSTRSQRHGNFFADVLNFRRKTKIDGWAFEALFVLEHDVVVYKTWSGQPDISEYRDRKNPLGPLQSLGSDSLKPDIGL